MAGLRGRVRDRRRRDSRHLEYGDLSEGWLTYSPLDEVPDLFLKFGKIHHRDDIEQAALAFCNTYGLPGNRQKLADSSWLSLISTPLKVEVSEFRNEARRAWGIVALYEAVLNGDAHTIEEVFFELRDDDIFWQWGGLSHRQRVQDYMQLGLICAVQTVEDVVHDLCRQRIGFAFKKDGTPDLATVNTAWDFDSLIGAMHLQMWWLMASAGDITRCEFCGRIVSLARSRPEGRKRRRDRRFCDDACRQAHHRSKKKA